MDSDSELGKFVYLCINLVLIAVGAFLSRRAFAIFGGFIQALIFTMLTAVYISLAIGGHEEHAAPAEEHEPGAAVAEGAAPSS